MQHLPMATPKAKTQLYGGHSMVSPLRRVLVCSPEAAGWDDPERVRRWRELGYQHEPNVALAKAQHNALTRALQASEAEVISLPGGDALTLDGVYCHDTSLLTNLGAIILRMGKASRAGEPARHRAFYKSQGIPVVGEIKPPGMVEGGDIVWLDAKTLLVGRGYRTNAPGIAQLAARLAPQGIEVIGAPLPHGDGPDACLHLMSLVSLLDERTALVDLAWLAVETVELLCACGFRLIGIEPAERATLACNVLALGRGRLLALEENSKTNERLRQHGFEVRTFPGSEVAINGSGGPTCLTRPLLRD